MRKLFLATLFFLPVLLFAQEKIFEQNIGWKNIGIDLHRFNNDTSACIVILNEDSIKVFASVENQSFEEIFTLRRKKHTEKFVGGYIKGDKIFLLLDNATEPGLHSILYDTKNKTSRENTFPFAITKERILGRLSERDQFFYLTVSKNNPELVIYRFTNEQDYETRRYTIPALLADKISRKSFKLFHITENSIVAPPIASAPYKSYLQKDTLRIVADATPFVTDIYEFDLASGYSNYRFIEHQPLSTEKQPTDISFLYKNRLCYGAASTDLLRIEVIDIHSGNVIKQHVASRNDDISFKNTPVIKEGGYFGTTRELEKTSQLLGKMTEGQIALTVYPDSIKNQARVTIGAYQKSDPFSFFDMLSIATGFSGVFGNIDPILLLDHSWEKTTRFVSLLDLNTGENIPGTIGNPIEMQIGAYRKQLNPLPQDEALYYHNDKYYYVYYSRDRILRVVRFD